MLYKLDKWYAIWTPQAQIDEVKAKSKGVFWMFSSQ